MRARHKKWTGPFVNEHPDLCPEKINPEDPFYAVSPLYLEIGIGKGDFIVGMASAHPGHYLGLERETDVLAMAAKKVIGADLTSSIRLRDADFDLVYEEIKTLKFDAIYLNFSDPWPKKKHWKRRLTTRERLSQMSSLLKPEGRIIMKTDNVPMFEWTLEEVKATNLEVVSSTEDYAFDMANDVQSEYERNFRAQGYKICRAVFSKKKGE